MKKVLVNLITCLVYLVCVGSVVPASAGVAEDTITYFHNDLSGSPIVATNAAGNVVWKENYRPYGERLVSFAPDESILFAGKKSDKVTGLSYMGARYYDPVTARFMGVDPVGVDLENLHSFNRYAYANNNPYKYVDPDGRATVLALAGMTLLVGGTMYAIAPPSQQQGMRDSLGRLMRAIDSALQSESSGSDAGGNAEPNKGTNSGDAKPADPGDKDPSTPTGQRASPIDVTPGTNKPTKIGDREYTGHALDQGQGRGVPPSAIEDAIQNGKTSPGNRPGTAVHVGDNGVKVVTGERGQVITVIPK
jgi:RHS repeat-associated protein